MSDLTGVLRWVNEIREAAGAAALAELPPGNDSGYGCPIAKALKAAGVSYVGVSWMLRAQRAEPLPDGIVEFIYDFDRGFYPDLVQP